jgi:hypothetical protein
MPPDVPRKPLRAAISGTPGERRLNRLKPPPCSTCHRDDCRVTLRTDYVLYFLCEHCLRVWSVPKPGHERYGT